jgi:HEAT repeat protein
MIQPKQSIGIFTTDINLNIRSWDTWLTSVTGLSVDSVRGTNLMELFPDIEKRGLKAYFERVLNEGMVEVLTSHSYLIPCIPQTFSKRFQQMQQQVTIVPLRDKDSIIGTIVTIEDVTPQLDREQDLTDLATHLENTQDTKNPPQSSFDKGEIPNENTQKVFGELGDDNWQVRQSAVETLVGHGGPEAITLLVHKIREEHQDLSILNSALKALSQIKGDIITPLTELLKVPDIDLRGYAVLGLGEQPDRRAIPPLIQALNDEDTNVKYNAIEALGKLQAIEAIDALASIAESHDFFLAFPALDALKRIGDPSITPRIIALLEDDMLREPAIEVLSQIGDETAVIPLAKLLTQPEMPTSIIAQAMSAIYDRYDELYNEGEQIATLFRQTINAPMQNLLEALNHTPSEELPALARLLGWLLDNTAIENTLTQLLGKPGAKKEVLKTLVRHGTQIGDFLMEQLEGSDMETRQTAILALGRIGDRRSVPILTRILTEDNEELIITAAEALTTIGDPKAYEPLLNLLSHPNAIVRQSAIAALNAINHPNMAERTKILLRDTNPLVRESAAKIVGYIGYQESFKTLLTCCHDNDERVRQAAIESLPYFEDECIITILTEALTQETPKIRVAAVRALGMMEPDNAVSLLQTALNDDDPWVRYFAARSLGEQNALQAWENLAQLAQTDKARQVRIAAIEALGQIGNSQVIPILTQIIESEESDLVSAAIRALGKIDHIDALQPLLVVLQTTQTERKLEEVIRALAHHREIESIQALQKIAAINEDNQIVQTVIETLAQLATTEAIHALIALTTYPSRREASVNALSQLGESQIDTIAQGLQHEQPAVRTATIDALVRMKNPFVSQYLVMALADNEALVRLAAITALGHLNLHGAEQKLSQIASEDTNLAVRRAAQKVLR